MRKIIVLLLFATYVSNLVAQADIAMSTSWYNRSNYNPASIARLNYIYIFSNLRNQWNGVAGAPKTINLQISGFNYEKSSAIGLSIASDRIGFVESINPMLSYAYRISNSEKWALSFGISAGVFGRTLSTVGFNPETSYDPVLIQNFEPLIKPDANVGVEFQSEHVIAGLSSTHLFSIYKPKPYYLISNHRYGYLVLKNTNSELYNIYAGVQLINRANLFVFETTGSIRFKHPTGLTTGPVELLEVGFTYRTSKQLSLYTGLNLSRDLKIGYAFDQSFLPGYNINGTHEIMLEYRIPQKSAQCPVCNVDDSWYR
ncbi:MAG: PorP/SprF family type IX secretion system membrane protein [Paludibacter sp.]|jgi:type IX secretion system PorP/SprF family membrane protein|nr:PorP/SprF family type IX secretion system membrane protein [Paludibacter sp.]